MEIFDPKQYELRGTLPEVFTSGQKELLNRTVSRVQGQLDWNAQLLGFNGPNYWGRRLPTTDRSYQWKGFPETAFEKRSLQVGAFGIYNKNLEYSQRPFPFNRSEIYTSGDQTFSVIEEGGKTVVFPYGMTKDFSYDNSPYVYQKAVYVFDQLVEVKEEQDNQVYVIQDKSQGITQVELFSEDVLTLTVKLENSSAKPFIFFALPWEDISDWQDPLINSLFLGLWGNKGNELPLHFTFDALNLHGFNEENSLVLDKVREKISLEKLFSKVGLTPTISTYLTSSNYRFWAEGCLEYFQPKTSTDAQIPTIQTQDFFDLQTEEGAFIGFDDGVCFSQEFYVFETDGEEENQGNYDNGDFDSTEEILGNLNNGLYPFQIPPTDTVADGGFSFNQPFQITTEDDKLLAQNQFELDTKPCYSLPEPKFGECSTPNYKIEFFQEFDSSDLQLAPDPGPEISFPLGCNGVSGLDPIGCGVDNNIYEVVGVPEFNIDNGTIDNNNNVILNNIFNGFYDQDPFSLCENNQFDPERNIEGDELVIDVRGEAGPVLYTDLGTEQPYTLSGYDPDVGEFELGFDGFRVGQFEITYEALTTVGKVEFPVIEWEFDLDLNNGFYYPNSEDYPIATADDGIFGVVGNINEGYVWDEGEYDPQSEILIIDQGILNQDIANCEVDNGILIYDQVPYLDPNILDGNGSIRLDNDCIIYDNGAGFDLNAAPICELDNGIEFESLPNEIADEGTYNKGLANCVPCGSNEIDQVSGISNLRLNLLESIYSALSWRMVPSVANSSTPLRVWKNRPLVTDFNLVADQNNGSEPIDNYEYYIRLPIEYPRSHKFWNRAEKTCHNFGYFGQSLTNTSVENELEPRRPDLYQSDKKHYKEGNIIYYEPYLESSIGQESSNSQEGFTNSQVSLDQEYVNFSTGKVTDYNPYDYRIPKIDGSWKGNYYYSMGNISSGHLEKDLLDRIVFPVDASQIPIWDTSSLLFPEISPPELEVGKIIKGHSVSYAYFVADFSASDEPIFDPTSYYCHRDKTVKGKTPVGNDFGIETENGNLISSEEVEIRVLEKESRTAYLLHS